MAYTVRISTRFKKDFKRCMKRGLNMKLITDAMDLLEATLWLVTFWGFTPHTLWCFSMVIDYLGQALSPCASR